jgi:hypothetical protein
MNAADILKYGHLTVCRTIDGLADSDWETGGVCGYWSTKDIIGHLAAYEHVLEDLLGSFAGSTETPYLEQFKVSRGFNDEQAALRKEHSVQQVLGEYNDTQARVMLLAPTITPEVWRKAGTLPWYGMEYALDDFIVYSFYGHKREHSAQIAVFRDTLKQR